MLFRKSSIIALLLTTLLVVGSSLGYCQDTDSNKDLSYSTVGMSVWNETQFLFLCIQLQNPAGNELVKNLGEIARENGYNLYEEIDESMRKLACAYSADNKKVFFVIVLPKPVDNPETVFFLPLPIRYNKETKEGYIRGDLMHKYKEIPLPFQNRNNKNELQRVFNEIVSD